MSINRGTLASTSRRARYHKTVKRVTLGALYCISIHNHKRAYESACEPETESYSYSSVQRPAIMALYKYNQFIQPTQDAVFDALHHPGNVTPYSGIYRCEVCGWEVVSEYNKPLPPQNHHSHPMRQPIQWRMVVYARHLNPQT